MRVQILKLNDATFLLWAGLTYGETYEGGLKYNVIAGFYNDGINYSYTDKHGNIFEKTGNTFRMYSKKTDSEVSATCTENSPFIRLRLNGATSDASSIKLYVDIARSDTRTAGNIRTIATTRNDEFSRWTQNENFEQGKAVFGLRITNNLQGVLLAKHNYDDWKKTFVSTSDCFSDTTSGTIITFDLTDEFYIDDITPPVPSTDPYAKGDSSTTSGGGGTFGGGTTIFGGTSDSVDIPPLPTASASSAGFITLFNPSLAQLNNLANYMWSDLFSLDTFKKIFTDPMDCILGLSIVPVKPASAGTSAVKIGNVSTDVSMNRTSSQYVAVDCGTIDVKEYWGAYLDYAPYTQCEIYLPYVGTKQISVDDVMNKAVHVVYHVDILSGACNAYVKCGDSVLYTFVGQCSSSIPISGNDWTNVLNGAISVAGKIGLAMATGGATALMSGLGAASSIISSSKPTVERSGAMSSTGGLLGIQKPYLILTRPKQALPENQNKYTGYPSFITMALSDCTGYTEIDSVHLENMSCTDEEAQEIENLLKSGVIF